MPAYYEVVDGVQLPVRLGGHPALEFCNTWAGWDGHTPGDYLKSYDDLAVWAGFVGLLPPDRVAALRRRAARRPGAAAEVLEEARRFRAKLYDVLANGAAGPARDAVLGAARAAASSLVLRSIDGSFRWEIGADAGLAAPYHAAAWAAAELLTSDDLPSVRSCPGTGCGWLFLDPRGRRRWCTMGTCGNRAKARRFAARHRAGPRARN